MPTADESRLNDLKQRWARDPGSRLYLQLADEHRKLGQLAEAESVLVKGLENRPSDLSGLVALGRVALELDKVDEALAALETVVGRDPAHIVANKLLLEVQLQKGDATKAGERLDICRLLNDRDPELEHLEYRLRQLRAASPAVDSSAEALFPEELPAAELPELEVSATDALEPEMYELEAAEPEAVEPETYDPEAAELEVLEPEMFELETTEPETTEPEATEPEAPAPETPAPETPASASALETRPPAAPLPANGDEIFHLGGGAQASSGLDSLWTSPSSAEPFGNLASTSKFADGDVFRLPPPVSRVEPPEPAAPARETGLPAPDAMDELTQPVAIRAPGEDAMAGGPVIHEELSEAAERDPLLDTQRTRIPPLKFAPDETEPIPEDVRLAAIAEAAEELAADAESEPVPDTDFEASIEEDLDLEAPTRKVETREPEPAAPEPAAPEPAAPEPAAPEPAAPAPPTTRELTTLERAPSEPITSEPVAPEPVAPEPITPEPAAPEAEAEEVATVALGGLYLKQGHIEEAARIFTKVLERDPGNHAALAGLNLARKPKQGERLTAMELFADRSLAGTIPAGLTAKKLLVLTNYLGQIRAARNRDDVR